MTTPQGLAFSSDTFAKLAPSQFLQAHLASKPSKRANGRAQHEFREAVVNTGSLAHSNGSAVVRLGDTAVVCGVRAEILLSSDIPSPPPKESNDLIERFGLLVPNLELSTGCSQAHLPGNPPSSLAQALSWRLYTLLHSGDILSLDDLQIQFVPPLDGDDVQEPVTKAYWTLYIDILCISLDGSCFSAAWIAVLAALQNTRLPKAHWDPDREAVLCSPLAREAAPLRLKGRPVCATFAVFSTASPLKQSSGAEHWALADPDTFEEDACRETITITVSRNKILRIERSGGPSLSLQEMKLCAKLAIDRWQEVNKLLTAG